jgi:predicted dehydrogenase
MTAHAARVCAWGFPAPAGDDYFRGTPFADETALFQMSNGATMRICEYRLVGVMGREMFNILGTEGAFYGDEERRGKSQWLTKTGSTPLTVEEMRTPLPHEVYEAFATCLGTSDVYGGHGGSHAYLVHEFVDAVAHERQPAINAWEAVRYMAPGVMAHKSALRDGEVLEVPDWGDAPV